MHHIGEVIDHPKKRRRRRRSVRSPIAAKLILDQHGKGDVALLSTDLFADLFGSSVSKDGRDHGPEEIKYVAMIPWVPSSPHMIEDASWSIIPVKVQGAREGVQNLTRSSLRAPVSSLSLESFFKKTDHGRGFLNSKSAIEILLLDVQPLFLDTVLVKVDGDALRKHEEVQKQFGGGFHANGNGHMAKGKGKESTQSTRNNRTSHHQGVSPNQSQEDRLRVAIRKSLLSSTVIHNGDLLPLPLPAHPITHISFPPVKITMCEPVDQGLLTGRTRILIEIVSGELTKHRPAFSPKGRFSHSIASEETDDTSAEQFFSAVENGHASNDIRRHVPEILKSPRSSSDSDDSQISGDSSSSDYSSDNMIALISPGLNSKFSGGASSVASATPRTAVAQITGINTPGSVYSNFTTHTTTQAGVAVTKILRTRALLQPISEDVLYPRPASNEDEEARIFVDVKLLVKLRCFAGDWVKISCNKQSKDSQENSWSVGLSDDGNTADDSRAVKIYSLPSSPSKDSLEAKRLLVRRKSRTTSPPQRPTPEAYLSPILLANLGDPQYIRLSPLLTRPEENKRFAMSKVDNSSTPPTAREITLLRVASPLSTERATQSGILVGLKQYFERKRRILRKDDLIGIVIDVGVSRILSESTPEIGNDNEELLLTSYSDNHSKAGTSGVAWFKVGQITASMSDGDPLANINYWGAALIEPMTTRMVQAGIEQCKLPSSLESPWEYYLKTRQSPRFRQITNKMVQSKEDVLQPYITPFRRRIRELLAVATSPRATYLEIKPIVILLHSTQRNIGKAFSASCACADLGLHVFPIDAYDILSEGGAGGGDVKTEASLKARIDRAMSCGPMYTIPLIRHLEALTADRMVSAFKEVIADIKAMIMTTTDLEKIPEGIRSLVTHELEVSAPDEGGREGILKEIVQLRGLKLALDVDFAAIAVKSAALVAGDLVDIVERALVARHERLEKLSGNDSGSGDDSRDILLRDIIVSGGAPCLVTKADFEVAVEAARKNFADAIGAPKIPNVSWDDVGGLSNVKDAVMETIQLPLERPELFAKGMKKRSGILFYGPPGTGKTLLAKAIATEFSLNFFSVKGPELLNMYIGESEANVRRVFQRARDARPCVVFFDELDSVAPKRGNQGDSGGVMDRIVSQLLAELDGMSDGDEGAGGVFVIGATNRPDLLDQALLRPGRFDKMLYLGISDTHAKQLTILEALTRKFTLHPDMSLSKVAESLPFTYTGADLYALCSDAMLKAVTRQASAVDAKIKAMPGPPITTAYFFDHFATSEDVAVVVTEDDFHAAQRELVGSVSAKELEHYQRVRQTFEGPPPSENGSRSVSSPAISDPREMRAKHIDRPLPSRPKLPTRTSTAKIKDKGIGKGKGKGKAIARWDSENDDEDEDDEDEDEDDAYVTSNDYGGTPSRSRDGSVEANGGAKGKGKGKGKEAARGYNGSWGGGGRGGFKDVSKDDEEELYG